MQSPYRESFSKMAETSVMDEAAEYALLVFLEELPSESDPNAAWTQHAKVIGARRALEILRTLHLKQEQPTPYKHPSLKPPK